MTHLKDMTDEERDAVIEKYAAMVVEDMTLYEMKHYIQENIEHKMTHECSLDEVTDAIEAIYPEILED